MLAVPAIAHASMLLTLSLSGGTAQGDAKPSVTWQRDLAEARSEAKRLGRPLLVFVCERHSSWHKVMERETFADAQVVELLRRRFVVVQIFHDEHWRFIERNEIQMCPTTLFESPQGNRIGELYVGHLNPLTMRRILGRISSMQHDW